MFMSRMCALPCGTEDAIRTVTARGYGATRGGGSLAAPDQSSRGRLDPTRGEQTPGAIVPDCWRSLGDTWSRAVEHGCEVRSRGDALLDLPGLCDGWWVLREPTGHGGYRAI